MSRPSRPRRRWPQHCRCRDRRARRRHQSAEVHARHREHRDDPGLGDNISIQNCQFFANFLSIAACFTLSTAKEFAVQNCYFRDTSSVLNFLNIVKSTGAANTVDGLTFSDNVVVNLGVTSNNTTILTANDIDRLTMQRNYLKWAVQNDKAIGVIVTAGVLTNLVATDNMGYRPNTTTAGGSFINVGGTTSTGIVARNLIQTLTTTTDLLFTTTVGLAAFDNRVSAWSGRRAFSFLPPIPEEIETWLTRKLTTRRPPHREGRRQGRTRSRQAPGQARAGPRGPARCRPRQWLVAAGVKQRQSGRVKDGNYEVLAPDGGLIWQRLWLSMRATRNWPPRSSATAGKRYRRHKWQAVQQTYRRSGRSFPFRRARRSIRRVGASLRPWRARSPAPMRTATR
jgi:hypothetical protein